MTTTPAAFAFPALPKLPALRRDPQAIARQTPADFDLGPITRAIIAVVGSAMSVLCLYAVARGVLGLTPELPHLRHFAVVLHVGTVLPAIPLGLYVMLTRKGTKRHKQLGKLWVALMLATATSAIFIQTGGSFSWIHIFVPLTFWNAWKIVSTARRGDIRAHKRELVGMYLFALMIPGIAAMAIPGRLMNVLLFW